MTLELETIDVQRPTVFGWPITVEMEISKRETVDVTHALRWDGKNITLDQQAVHEAVNSALCRGFGLTTTEEDT